MFGPKHIGAMNDLDLSGSPDVIGHVIIRFAMGISYSFTRSWSRLQL